MQSGFTARPPLSRDSCRAIAARSSGMPGLAG